MNELSYGDKIFKLLQKLEKNLHKPDLHSFKGQIKDGSVFVEARRGEVFIDDERGGNRTSWAGTYIAAANRLEMLGLDLDTVEI